MVHKVHSEAFFFSCVMMNIYANSHNTLQYKSWIKNWVFPNVMMLSLDFVVPVLTGQYEHYCGCCFKWGRIGMQQVYNNNNIIGSLNKHPELPIKTEHYLRYLIQLLYWMPCIVKMVNSVKWSQEINQCVLNKNYHHSVLYLPPQCNTWLKRRQEQNARSLKKCKMSYNCVYYVYLFYCVCWSTYLTYDPDCCSNGSQGHEHHTHAHQAARG